MYMHVTIPYGGIIDTNVESFGLCRAEIRQYLLPFTDWFISANRAELSDNRLVDDEINCETLGFMYSSFTANVPTCRV